MQIQFTCRIEKTTAHTDHRTYSSDHQSLLLSTNSKGSKYNVHDTNSYAREEMWFLDSHIMHSPAHAAGLGSIPWIFNLCWVLSAVGDDNNFWFLLEGQGRLEKKMRTKWYESWRKQISANQLMSAYEVHLTQTFSWIKASKFNDACSSEPLTPGICARIGLWCPLMTKEFPGLLMTERLQACWWQRRPCLKQGLFLQIFTRTLPSVPWHTRVSDTVCIIACGCLKLPS